MRILALMVALAACNGGGGSRTDASAQGDGAIADATIDGAIDALIDAMPDAMIDAPPADTPPGAGFDLTGIVDGTGPTGATFVVWTVVSGQPDYSYKWGEGTTNTTSFMVTFGSGPPAQALNNGELGVGMVVVTTATTQPPDGELQAPIGPASYTPMHRIIYKAPNATDFGWTTEFPTGYSCGMCVPQSAGFDTFTPVDCGTVVLDHTPLGQCNWT